MPWQVENVMDKRIQFVSRSIQPNINFSALCREFGISRKTGYKWNKRYKDVKTFSLLTEKSRRPHHSPARTDPDLEKRVIEIRSKWGFGAKKIQWELAKETIYLPVITINRILKRSQQVHLHESTPIAPNRFQRESPNEMWQMDFKGEYPLPNNRYYPLSILDDCSRFLISLTGEVNRQGPMVETALLQAFDEYGVPQAFLLDHGTPWWSPTNAHGLTWLSVSLINQDIQLFYTGFRHPQTQGKVERFHRTLHEAIVHRGQPKTVRQWHQFLKQFREMYNEQRPHEALEMRTPSEVYQPSKKSYNPNPPEWIYDSGQNVAPLNSRGFLTYASHRYFVCEALAHQNVGFIEVDQKVLVQYRNVFIREIDLKTKRTVALVESVVEIPSGTKNPPLRPLRGNAF